MLPQSLKNVNTKLSRLMERGSEASKQGKRAQRALKVKKNLTKFFDITRDGQYRDTCIGDMYRAILLYRYRYRFSYFSKYRVSVSLNSYFTYRRYMYRRYKLYSDVIYRDGQYRDTCIGDTYRAILLYRYRYRFSYFSKYRVSVSL